MKLVGPWLSGYTRRVGITLRLLNIEFEHLPYHAYAQKALVRQFSPMGRVPALVLDDGDVLIDSGAIVDYLDSLVTDEQRLLPDVGLERKRAMHLLAFATACYDKLARYCDEMMLRPVELRIADIQAGYEEQLLIGFGVLDRAERMPWLLGEKISQADVMTVVAYQSACVVMPASVNAARFPGLAALSDAAMSLSAFNQTLPTAEELAASGIGTPG